MNTNLFILFVVLNIVNVVLQTIKSLLTNKGGKWSAAISNMVAYGLYTVLLVYMTCDLYLMLKVAVVGGCNFIGVFIVKLVEEKMQKDRLWKIELTISNLNGNRLHKELEEAHISHNWQIIDRWAVFNCYAPTKKESHIIRETAKQYDAKFFANEAKIL